MPSVPMIELFDKPTFNFLGRRGWSDLVSAVVMVIGLGALVTKGLRYDIDFTGGNLVQVRFEQAPTVGAIRTGLARIGLAESIIQEFGDPREFIIRVPLAAG